MNPVLRHFSIFVVAIAGTVTGIAIVRVFDHKWVPSVNAASRGEVLSVRGLELVDSQGKKVMVMGTSGEGSPAIWFFDKNGKSRLNFGLYGDGNAMIVLNDENEQAVEIFRTVGPSSSPVSVFKSKGQDRMILGLNGPGSSPFFVTYDDKGSKKPVFGSY